MPCCRRYGAHAVHEIMPYMVQALRMPYCPPASPVRRGALARGGVLARVPRAVGGYCRTVDQEEQQVGVDVALGARYDEDAHLRGVEGDLEGGVDLDLGVAWAGGQGQGSSKRRGSSRPGHHKCPILVAYNRKTEFGPVVRCSTTFCLHLSYANLTWVGGVEGLSLGCSVGTGQTGCAHGVVGRA